MRHRLLITALLICASNLGCVMFEVGVTNPVAGLSTVAVAPFFNLSEEPTVDGRRFAQAYFAALQQTPGFEVVPVGVVEQAIYDHKLKMNSPDDALKLAEILHVDAVVVGAVTDYSPYYPPRLGLKVAWYSQYPWEFAPGIAVHEEARWFTLGRDKRFKWNKNAPCDTPEAGCPPQSLPPGTAVRGQSVESPAEQSVGLWNRMNGRSEVNTMFDAVSTTPPQAGGAASWRGTAAAPFNPREPLMSYVRLFDGADPRLTARLRDYRELSGDLRSGGWEAYLQRSEDFIRFTSHVMVVEMLQLHGGESHRRVVLKRRKYH